MIVTTMDGIAGRITQETMGVVRGTQLWTRRVIKSSFGGIRNFEVTGLKDLDAGLNEAEIARATKRYSEMDVARLIRRPR